MPAYNEARSIFACVQETARALEGTEYEIIVVDDGSADNTRAEALRAAEVNGQVKVVAYGENSGKGHALKYGFGHTAGELVAFLDADLDLHPCQIWTLYEVMQQTGADVVIGSKRHPESKLDYPWQRRFVSWGYFTLVHLLFGLPIHDTQTGIKLFKREVLERVFPRMQVQRFAHDLELLVGAHRFGYRIAEAPVSLNFREGKMGPLALARASFNTWLDTLRVFYWASFWKWLGPGTAAKCWAAALLVGVSALSFGTAGFLTRAGVPQALGNAARVVFLKFLSQPVRDGLLIVGGALAILISALQLNKLVLKAFAHPDQGDLAGIARSNVKRET
jgi:glycosyltransferase involved in cell wall biosynthesis